MGDDGAGAVVIEVAGNVEGVDGLGQFVHVGQLFHGRASEMKKNEEMF